MDALRKHKLNTTLGPCFMNFSAIKPLELKARLPIGAV